MGLQVFNYGIDYAKDNPNIKVTVITVSTPYSANSYADIVQWLPQDAYKELAGRDGALDRLKEKSNGYIYSNNFSVYAISVLADASLPEVEWEAIGDIIVPLSSQKGGEFKGITKMPTITNYNYKSQSHGIGGWDNPYHHVNTPSLSEVVQQIDKIISNTI